MFTIKVYKHTKTGAEISYRAFSCEEYSVKKPAKDSGLPCVLDIDLEDSRPRIELGPHQHYNKAYVSNSQGFTVDTIG